MLWNCDFEAFLIIIVHVVIIIIMIMIVIVIIIIIIIIIIIMFSGLKEIQLLFICDSINLFGQFQ